MRAFADSSVVIDVLEGGARGMRFASFLLGGDREWCASPLVRMECRVRALASGDERRLGEAEVLLGTLTSLLLTDEVFERAALVRAQTSLKTPDALHVATALAHGCAELWTADERLAKTTISGLDIRLVA